MTALIDHGKLSSEWLAGLDSTSLSVLLNSLLSSSSHCLNTLQLTHIRALQTTPIGAKLITQETASRLDAVVEERIRADRFSPQVLSLCALKERPRESIVLGLLDSAKKLIFEPQNARAFRNDLNFLILTAHQTAKAAELDTGKMEAVLL